MLFYMHVGKVPFQNPIKTNFGFRNIAAKEIWAVLETLWEKPKFYA